MFGAAQKLLDGLVRQDVLMIEEEQQAYLQNQERKNYELNRALVSVQRLMKRQIERGDIEIRPQTGMGLDKQSPPARTKKSGL